MLDEQLAIAKANVKLNDSTLRIVNLQYDAGMLLYWPMQQTESAATRLPLQLIPQFECVAITTSRENALRIFNRRRIARAKYQETPAIRSDHVFLQIWVGRSACGD